MLFRYLARRQLVSAFPNPFSSPRSRRTMVTLVVATTIDPASVGPADCLLAMPGWTPGPTIPEGIVSFTNRDVRVLKHGSIYYTEDDLDRRWKEATGESVDEIIYLSQHNAVTSRPSLTIHPIGVPHLRDDEVPYEGGRPGWAAPPSPRIGAWFRLMKTIAQEHGLVPEFEVTLEVTHHGPVANIPAMFLEIGSSAEYWGRQDAAQVLALVMWKGLGMEGGGRIGDWPGSDGKNKVLFGLGGGHYASRHMDIVAKDGVWMGHVLSGYSLPMDDPKDNEIGGTWKHSIDASYEATKSAFPGGEIIAHLDQKSFKSWQKKAIISYLEEKNIKIGKPTDFP